MSNQETKIHIFVRMIQTDASARGAATKTKREFAARMTARDDAGRGATSTMPKREFAARMTVREKMRRRRRRQSVRLERL